MATAIEKMFDEQSAEAREAYRELVISAVEHPEVAPDRARIREILRAVERTPEQLLADITKVREAFDAAAEVQRTEREAKAIPELQKAKQAADERIEKLQAEFNAAFDATVNESERLANEIMMLKRHAIGAQQRLGGKDWRMIELFPAPPERKGPSAWQQPRSERIAGVGSTPKYRE